MKRFYIYGRTGFYAIGGGAGGGGGSSSSSNTTNQTDERIAASDDAIVISLDENSSITLTDPAGQEFLGEALNDAEQLFSTVIEFANQQADVSSGLIHRSLDQSDKVIDELKTQEQQTLKQVVQLAGIVTAGYAAAKIFGAK